MSGPHAFLLWLDEATWRYWLVAVSSFGFACALAWPVGPLRRLGPVWSGRLFVAAIFLTLAAFRWTGWFVPYEQNPDEAQTIASALTLQVAPVYWKHVDGTTHGPLCELPLVLAALLGAPYSYVTARVIAVLMQAMALWATLGTLRCFVEERVARLAILPGLAFWSFTAFHDFVHYSTELPGLLLLALAGWGIALVATRPMSGGRAMVLSFLSGLALGAVPFAKLQSAPHALVLGVVGLAAVYFCRGRARHESWLGAPAAMAGGAITVPLIVAIHLTIFGLWAQFRYAYIESSVAYTDASQRTLVSMPSHFFDFVANGFSFAWFFFGVIAFSLVYAHRMVEANARLKVVTCLALVMLAASYATVILPRREVGHYLHLLVLPLCTVGGLILGANLHAGTSGGRGGRGVLAAFGLLALLPQIHYRWIAWHPDLGELRKHLAAQPSEAAGYITQRAAPGETMAMWGWEPSLHVETGLPHATREAHTALQISDSPHQHFYRTRYLRDIKRAAPVWFVDATGPGAFIFDNRTFFGHESLPELGDYISKNYTLVAEFGYRRIYRRHLSAADEANR